MAEAKIKEVKVETRDVAYEQVASAIMQDSKLTKLKRHKEGLELVVNGEVVVLRIIKSPCSKPLFFATNHKSSKIA